jgi:hypothetical protein
MAEADTRSDEEKQMAERRLTDPGIYMVGDKVIWDGEAETLKVPPKTTLEQPPVIPLPPEVDPDADADADG